jgi:hypothetical protein
MLIPLWSKLAYTLFVCVLVPVYWRCWGPRNFLWFSDVALLVTVVALWLESPLLASMMTLAIALPETAWNIDFFGRLATGRQLLGLSGYMFDSRTPRWLRALSLHVALPVVLLAWSCDSGTTGVRGSCKRSSRGSGCLLTFALTGPTTT